MLVLLLGCSDYDLNKRADGTTPLGDDSGTLPVETGDIPIHECPAPNLDATGVAVDESCIVEAHPGTFTPVVEWNNAGAGASYVTPVVGHLNDDDGDGVVTAADMPDVVMVNTLGVITAMSGDGGAVHWTATIAGSEPSTPAIGDVDGDGFGDVVAAAGYGTVAAFSGLDGRQLWLVDSTELSTRAICGAVGLYDLDGDGRPEVVHGNVILDGQTGARRGVGRQGAGTGYSGGYYASMGVAADINQDGTLEVVVGNALYDADGNTIWANGQADGWVAVGNFDGDPYGEIVVAWYPGMLRLQDDDGTVIWSGGYTGSTIGPPTIADFDNDGMPEIGVAGMGQYVVVDTDGTLMWTRPTQDFSSGFTGSAVFDFEGDGQAEAVYADENALWVFDGATGAVKLEETRHSSLTCSESPAIADVDNDGHAEILYSSYPYSSPESGVTVVGDLDNSWMPARGVWNQHSYDITNVNDDSTIPAAPATNWLSYNTFRSADLSSATGGVLPDAVPDEPDVCLDDCDEGRIEVVLRVGNGGVGEMAAGVPWTLYSQVSGVWVVVAEGETPRALGSGATTAGVVVELTPDQVPDGVLELRVDDRGGYGILTECHEDNNAFRVHADCE